MESKQPTGGVINSGELYTIVQLKVRLGLTDSALRKLRRRGLPVIRTGKRAFVSGRKVIEFLEGIEQWRRKSK